MEGCDWELEGVGAGLGRKASDGQDHVFSLLAILCSLSLRNMLLSSLLSPS